MITENVIHSLCLSIFSADMNKVIVFCFRFAFEWCSWSIFLQYEILLIICFLLIFDCVHRNALRKLKNRIVYSKHVLLFSIIRLVFVSVVYFVEKKHCVWIKFLSANKYKLIITFHALTFMHTNTHSWR